MFRNLSRNPERSRRAWFVYILQCSDKTLYTGITPDIQKRLVLHNSGKAAKYTRGRIPAKLVYKKKFNNKSEARKREIQIKRWSRIKKQKLSKEYLSSPITTISLSPTAKIGSNIVR